MEKERSALALRLRDFMLDHDLTHERAATVIETPMRTLNNWLNDGTRPPGCLAALLTILEKSEEARVLLGVHELREKGKPRGKPFAPGNAWRFPPGMKTQRDDC